ncbi:23750_t:CDS:2 [Cetraspora pellucida]|uniref:23750_t:CDS:1 n=1 Tax=Cetraspora pellucida TaxID=1433469 RepID=A0A9N9CNY1_9GLOM|nr:23750_t:CDS:2 [Cetraspora pellucida]
MRKSNHNVLLILDDASLYITGANSVLVVLTFLSPHIEDVKESLFVDPDNELAIMKLQQIIDALHIYNSISIKDLLDLKEEKTEIH